MSLYIAKSNYASNEWGLLKFENLVLGISQFLEDPADRTLLEAFLLSGDRVDLSRWAWSAHESFRVSTQSKWRSAKGEEEVVGGKTWGEGDVCVF